jgi:hypothetical protein
MPFTSVDESRCASDGSSETLVLYTKLRKYTASEFQNTAILIFPAVEISQTSCNEIDFSFDMTKNVQVTRHLEIYLPDEVLSILIHYQGGRKWA